MKAAAATEQPAVQLVVKAPNQQIDDQLIACTLSWTVLMLKQHLSAVYPSKPNVEDQKLIYSGQLLHNHLTLKDFLRQYDTETVHTLHLVCVPQRESYDPSPSKSSKTSSQSSSAHPTVVPLTTEPAADGLRHRSPYAVGFPMAPEPMMAMHPFAADIPGMPAQLAWMNQVYSQYMNVYYQQYLGQIQPQIPTEQPILVPPPPTPVAEPVAVNNNAAAAAAAIANNNNVPAEPAPVAVDRQPGANLPGMMGAAAVADDDAEDAQGGGQRDWLDWTYSICRAAVLFVIIHYYSSVGRFAVVALVAALIYVHQMGWLDPRLRRPVVVVRPRAVVPNAEGGPRIEPQPDAEGAPARLDADELRAPAEDRAVEDQNGIRELELLMNHDVDQPNGNRREVGASSLVNTAWTIVATFFSSLLPERPEQVML